MTSFDLHKYVKLQIEWTLICSKMHILNVSIPLNLGFTLSSMAFYSVSQTITQLRLLMYAQTWLSYFCHFTYTAGTSCAACNCHLKYQQTLHCDLACMMCVKSGTLTVQHDTNWR